MFGVLVIMGDDDLFFEMPLSLICKTDWRVLFHGTTTRTLRTEVAHFLRGVKITKWKEDKEWLRVDYQGWIEQMVKDLEGDGSWGFYDGNCRLSFTVSANPPFDLVIGTL